MKYYNYQELSEGIEIAYQQGLREYGNSDIEAITYCFYAYEADVEYGLDESVLIPLLIGKEATNRTSRLFKGQYDLFKKACTDALEKIEILSLEEHEKNDVLNTARNLIKKMELIEIETDSLAK